MSWESADPSFVNASDVLLKALDWLWLARRAAEDGRVGDACQMLRAVAILGEHSPCLEVIQENERALARVSVGEMGLAYPPREEPIYFASCHEMIAHLLLALTFRQDLTDTRGEPRDGETCRRVLAYLEPILSLNTSRLRARIKIERERMLAGDPTQPDPPTIISLGHSAYGIAKWDPVKVGDREDTVLQAFLERSPLSESELIQVAGFEDAPRVLRSLRGKYDARFEPAIRIPGGKAGGGYHVRIRLQE